MCSYFHILQWKVKSETFRWHRKLTLKVKFCHFLTARHYTSSPILVISIVCSWFLAKNFSICIPPLKTPQLVLSYLRVDQFFSVDLKMFLMRNFNILLKISNLQNLNFVSFWAPSLNRFQKLAKMLVILSIFMQRSN